MDNNDLDNKLRLFGSRHKDYKSHPDDLTYYRLNIQPYQVRKCGYCESEIRGKKDVHGTYMYYCGTCKKYRTNDEVKLSYWKRVYTQETVRDGAVSKGSRDVPKVIYNRSAVAQAQKVIFCTSENDCDYLASIGIVATTVIGQGKNKFASYVWKFYKEDLRGKDVLFVARSDAEEKQMLKLVKDHLIGVVGAIRMLNLFTLFKRDPNAPLGRKHRIRRICNFNSVLNLHQEHEMRPRLNEYYISNRLETLSKQFIPEDYIDGYEDVESLKPDSEIQAARKAVEKQARLLEDKAKKYAEDKQRERTLLRRRANKAELDHIKSIIIKHFPEGQNSWKTSPVKLCHMLTKEGIELSPKKLMVLLNMDTCIIKKCMGKGKTLLTLRLPVLEEPAEQTPPMG